MDAKALVFLPPPYPDACMAQMSLRIAESVVVEVGGFSEGASVAVMTCLAV